MRRKLTVSPRLSEIQSRAQRGARTEWYKIANKDSDEAEIRIYGMIGDLYGDGSGISASDFADELAQVTASTMKVRINSEGGSVFEGVAIYNALLEHPAKVNVIVDALAASAASFIAMAGDTVTMTRNGRMMIHDAQGFVMGPASDMREMAALLDDLSDNIADIYVQKAGEDIAHWRTLMSKDTWFSAQAAVEAGLADGIQGGSKAASNTLNPPPVLDIDGLRNALKGAVPA